MSAPLPPEPRIVSSPPPEDVIEELDAEDLELVESVAERPATTPPPPPDEPLVDARHPDTLEGEPSELDVSAILTDENAFVEYPTELISGRPLDPVLVAWLLEDEQPT